MGVATGTFTYPNGSPIASGLYQFKLSAPALFSNACNVPVLFTGLLDTSGHMTATFNFNDVLTPTTTSYQLTVKDIHGGQVWNGIYTLTGTAANINIIVPS